MKVFILIVFTLFIGLVLFVQYAKKFSNPYLIEYYIGVRGAGKSTFATKEAIKFMQQGHRVYSNFEVFGTYRIDSSDVGFYHLPPESVLLLDEVSLIWSNRDFKNFPKEVEAFFRYCRKYRIYCRLYSQSFDVDAKIRGLVDSIFILVKVANVFSIAKRVKRTIVLHSSSKDDDGVRQSEGFVSENYSYDLPTTWKIAFIPRWVQFFNSFEAPVLPKKEHSKYQFINESRMYKLTHYSTYKKEQIKEIKAYIQHKYHIWLYSFQMEWYKYKMIQFSRIRVENPEDF